MSPTSLDENFLLQVIKTIINILQGDFTGYANNDFQSRFTSWFDNLQWQYNTAVAERQKSISPVNHSNTKQQSFQRYNSLNRSFYENVKY